jgi:hypothetical protein
VIFFADCVSPLENDETTIIVAAGRQVHEALHTTKTGTFGIYTRRTGKLCNQLFGTEDLLTSFDAVNVSLANRKDLPANKAWAHQDQGKLRAV